MEMQTKSPQLIANNIKHNDLALDFRPIGLQNQYIIQKINQIYICLTFQTLNDTTTYRIFPIKQNGQYLKIENNQKILQINKKIINFYRFNTPWKLQINPKNGFFCLNYKIFKLNSLEIKFQVIVDNYFSDFRIRNILKQIVFATNQLFKQKMAKLLKYASNCDKYAWGLGKNPVKIQKLQKWQTQSDDSDLTDSIQAQSVQHELKNTVREQDKNINLASDSIRSSLYEKTKKLYNQQPIFQKQKDKFQKTNNQNIINYHKQQIICEETDAQIYEQYLSGFNLQLKEIQTHFRNNCKQHLELNIQDNDSTIQSHLDDEQIDFKKKKKKHLGIELNKFFIKNKQTITKRTIWSLILKIISQIFKTMYQNSSFSVQYKRLSSFTLFQSLQISLIHHNQIFSFLNCEQKMFPDQQLFNQGDEQFTQKKISLQILSIILQFLQNCTKIITKSQVFSNKNINTLKKLEDNLKSNHTYFYNGKKIRQQILNNYFTFQGELDMQQYLFYAIWANTKSFKTIPYADWILIMVKVALQTYQ